MAKSVSACKNRRIQKGLFFSESEIDVAIQLIHLREDSDSYDEMINSSSSCSSDKFNASASKAKNEAAMEEDGGQSSHSGGTGRSSTTPIADIFEEKQDDKNRGRRKRRSRSVYEIYKLTKPIIAVN